MPHGLGWIAMRGKPRSPLPQRHGLDAVRLRTPSQGQWPTFRDYLLDRLPAAQPHRIDAMLRAHEFVGPDGPITQDAAFQPNAWVWFHRDPPDEVPVPFDINIVHRDDTLLVVDKPHFLATTPRGGHVMETALVRLRRDLALPQLSPLHRLDRSTAGLVMFSITPEHRGAYQSLFQERLVHKEYAAIAPVTSSSPVALTVRSRIVKRQGSITAQEVPGSPNAESFIELTEQRGTLGRYRLVPTTGRTHQLRLHLSRLGIPILGDDFYPQLREKPADDFTRPLQLLATALEFTDPITGRLRRFDTGASLAAWEAWGTWANQ